MREVSAEAVIDRIEASIPGPGAANGSLADRSASHADLAARR
jgi:hypothetical protein